ncbi:MAG: hypothetical protein R2711_05885 [Acidimicrobiales bacterium]
MADVHGRHGGHQPSRAGARECQAQAVPDGAAGKANGLITLGGVAGGSVGLSIAGHLGDRYGTLGPGIALLALGPLVVAALVLALYPETAHVELEELNPEDAPATGFAPPLT